MLSTHNRVELGESVEEQQERTKIGAGFEAGVLIEPFIAESDQLVSESIQDALKLKPRMIQ